MQICQNGVCDGGKDPSTVPPGNDRILQPAWRFERLITLQVSYADGGMAWADIGNGSPGDEVWLDRRINGQEELSLGRTPAGGLELGARP